MNHYDLLCKLTNKELELSKKNPHTTQFFCDIKDILNCSREDCSSVKGYKYKREFNDSPLNESNISNLDLDNLYYQKEIKEVLDKDSKSAKYQPRRQRPSTVIHWGQLKLFLSTLQFLLYFAPRSEKVHVIYPGSASGYNIEILTKMFPQCYWYLIDPNPFYEKLKSNPKIVEIKNEYFTDELAEYYKNLLKDKYVLFISDIRTEPTEEEIFKNNNWQKKWVQIINPEYSQLKFRIPRIGENYVYLEGNIYLQMYPPLASTETRLVVKKNAKEIKYNLESYENKLYYHNRVLRACVYPNNIKIKGLDNCYDCSAFVGLITKYKYKYRKIEKRKIKKIIKHIIYNLFSINKLEKETMNICKNLN
ncbi:Poly A polymerase regulatory subunit [seawater metagenome]|uniref:Cap-specific mRNA (nucleoside-2'-O-)-methyltransferase n=1 Tax=seawater metagenome TaxID=1561972 RepID=A0A5E8CJA9_9ZZZZ